MKFSRISLKKNVTIKDIHKLVWYSNWELYKIIPASEESPFERVWFTPDKQTSIHYIEDDIIGINYLVVDGNNQTKIISEILNSLDTFEKYEILDFLQKEINSEEEDEYINAVYHLGIIATPDKYEQELFELFEKVFSHPNTEVRHAAIMATHYAGWFELKVPLEKIKNTDPDVNIREFANSALYALTQTHLPDDN